MNDEISSNHYIHNPVSIKNTNWLVSWNIGEIAELQNSRIIDNSRNVDVPNMYFQISLEEQ